MGQFTNMFASFLNLNALPVPMLRQVSGVRPLWLEMGGYLACVETEKERQFLANLANGKVLWVGGSDAKQEGQLVWLNGKRVVLKHVDNSVARDYLGLNRGGVLHSRRMSGVEDFTIKRTQGFICEWNR